MASAAQQFAVKAGIATPAVIPQSRLISLDVFRGMTIAAMILVNNAGDWSHVYRPLDHAEWNGWTPTDLIFPFFLFIVGVSMVLSFASREATGATRRSLMRHTLKRAAIIFALGICLYAYPPFDLRTIRIPGVLQRIAVVYLISSVIVLYCGRKTRAVITGALLLGYWAMLKLIPVPGHGPGVLTMDGSLAGYVDRALLYNHLWIAHRFDPEGVVSTLPAIATCMLGVFTGEWIREQSGRHLLRRLLVGAVAGWTLGKLWNLWFPINKNLWTSSYVLFTAGFALAGLAFCYWMVDVRGWRKWGQPFVWYGINPLAIYFLASLLAEATLKHRLGGRPLAAVVYDGLYTHLTRNPYTNSMLYGLSYVLLFLLVAWALHRKKILIRV